MNSLHVGIDVSLADLKVCFMDNSEEQIGKIQVFDNSLPHAKRLEKMILEQAKAVKAKEIRIGTEATSVYDVHIIDFLASSKSMAKAKAKVYRFNPKIIKKFKDTYVDMDKTDPKDAFAIADKLRCGRLPRPYEAHLEHRPLQRLTRYRIHLVDTIRRETQFFMTHLFLKYSRFGDIHPFSNTMGKTSIAVINDISGEELMTMDLEELTQFIVKNGKNRFKTPKKIATALQRAVRESYRLRPTMAESVDLILASTCQTIRTLKATLKQINHSIEQQVKAFPNTLTSVKGIGPIFAAGIMAEIGDISNYPAEDSLAKFAGLTWKKIQSGKFNAEETRLTKTGSAYLRYYLVEAANSMRVHNEEYQAYYKKKYREVPKHRHKRALVLTARKLVRLIFALLTKKQLYDTKLHAGRN